MNNPTRSEKHAEIAAAKTAQPAKALSHNPWELIEVGATVLYRASKDEGWFECKVLEKKAGNTLVLKWKDYPGFPAFDARRTAVGLICTVK